jgi:hypothetical protein
MSPVGQPEDVPDVAEDHAARSAAGRGRRGRGFSSVQWDDAGEVKTVRFERSAAPAAVAG